MGKSQTLSQDNMKFRPTNMQITNLCNMSREERFAIFVAEADYECGA
jgi:hypothetical protein